MFLVALLMMVAGALLLIWKNLHLARFRRQWEDDAGDDGAGEDKRADWVWVHQYAAQACWRLPSHNSSNSSSSSNLPICYHTAATTPCRIEYVVSYVWTIPHEFSVPPDIRYKS